MRDLIHSYLRIGFQTLTVTLRSIERRLPPQLACKLQNSLLKLLGSDLRFSFSKEKSLFIARQGKLLRYFGDMERGFSLYNRDMNRRAASIGESYCLENISFQRDDVVVDCGANYGDLFLYLADKVDEENYVAFEPGPTEFQCLVNSLPSARIYNVAMSSDGGEMDFFVSSASGDSSLVEPATYTDIIRIKVEKLDSYFEKGILKRCKLLKVEAEGWEPEILEGALRFLDRCEFVAVDGGPERGVQRSKTLPAVNNLLLSNGFEMVDLFGRGYRALYRRL